MSFFEPTSRSLDWLGRLVRFGDWLERAAFRFDWGARYVAALVCLLALLAGVGYVGVKVPVVGAIVVAVALLGLVVYLLNRLSSVNMVDGEGEIPFHLGVGEYGGTEDGPQLVLTHRVGGEDWEGSGLEWTTPNGADDENRPVDALIALALSGRKPNDDAERKAA